MLSIRSILCLAFICFWCSGSIKADNRDLQNCEAQLNKYRKFLLQAILSFGEVCEVYTSRATPTPDVSIPPQLAYFGRSIPTEQMGGVWQFLKMLMAQFNDLEFSNIIREAVIERCRAKLQMQQQEQRDEKRNSVILGKKQRFHSWGGKRSGSVLEGEHNDDGVLGF